MDNWAYERGVELDFGRPREPTDSARLLVASKKTLMS